MPLRVCDLVIFLVQQPLRDISFATLLCGGRRGGDDRAVDLEAGILRCQGDRTCKVHLIVDRVVVGTGAARAATCARTVALLRCAGPGWSMARCIVCVPSNA